MGRADRLGQFFRHDLWVLDLKTLHGFRRLGVQALWLAYAVGMEFRRRLLDARAAGLVYTTLLSLVPLLAVMFSVLKAFGVHYQAEPILEQFLEPLGAKGQEITANLLEFVDNLDVGVLGIVGVAALFYTTYSLLDQIEEALNAIWRVRQSRPWMRKLSDYFSVVLVGPLLIMTVFGLLASVQSTVLVQRVLEIQPFGWATGVAARVVPFLILATFFSFLYKFVPYTSVRFVSALVGGTVAAGLWVVAGQIFAAFFVTSARYSAIYSGFAILVLFLLWIYIAWLIILVGAQVSFFHQHPLAYHSRLLWKQGTHGFRERTALALLREITCRYLQALPPYTLPDLAADVNVPVSIAEEQIDQLVEHGIVCLLQEPPGVGLVKPPESVSVADVLEALRDRSEIRLTRESHDPVDAVLRRRDRAVARALAGVTLRSLALDTESAIDEESRPPLMSQSGT